MVELLLEKDTTAVHSRDVNGCTPLLTAVHLLVKTNSVNSDMFGFLQVLEVRPVIDWNKGKAVEFLPQSLGLSDCDDMLPIFIGDDRTDEDAFKVLRKGNRRYGILVSPIPKETNAFYSLRDPSEVKQFLEALVQWREQKHSTK